MLFPERAPFSTAPVRRRGSRGKLRGDIQALRGVAVLLVVVDHLLVHFTADGGRSVHLTGAFVGVDVFFVISGYLITGQLLAGRERTGRTGFLSFYARRVRRILPAALLVLLVTVVAARLLWFSDRAHETALAAMAALAISINWWLIRIDADYLAAGGPVSPLQHYWSLSVEEQFYLVWPAVLAVVLWLAPRRARAVVAAVVVVLATVSLAWAAWRGGTAPQAAYFDTGARVWQLLAGALVGCIGTAAPGSRWRAPVAGTGFALILASAFVVTPQSPFPFPWAALPVAGAAAVVWARADQDSPLLRPVVNRVTRYVGDISYSLYLWHFPVIVFATSVWGTSLPVLGVSLVLMTGLSVASYRLVERPFREVRSTPSSPVRRPLVPAPPALIAAVAATAVIVGVAVVSRPTPLSPTVAQPVSLPSVSLTPVPVLTGSPSTTTAGTQSALPVAESPPADPSPAVAAITPTPTPVGNAEQAALTALIQQSLATTSWGGGLPPGTSTPALRSKDCRNTVSSSGPPGTCTWGDGSAGRTVMVVGDSVALAWTTTIQGVFLPRGWRVVALGYDACSVVDVSYNLSPDPGFPDQCSAARGRVRAAIAEVHPDLLVISTTQEAMEHLTDGASGDAAAAQWQTGVETTVRALAPSADSIVLLANPPAGPDPAECARPRGSPRDCDTSPTGSYRLKADAEARAAAALASAGLPVRAVDVEAWFCADRTCPTTIGGSLVRIDAVHLTDETGRLLVPVAATTL